MLIFYYGLMIPFQLIFRLLGFYKKTLKESHLMIVFGSGGHTTEMLLMIQNLDFNKYGSITFVIGHSDTWSLTKVKDFFLKKRNINIEKDFRNLRIISLFRSREVKQSYLTSVFTTLWGLVNSLLIIAKCQPDIVSQNDS